VEGAAIRLVAFADPVGDLLDLGEEGIEAGGEGVHRAPERQVTAGPKQSMRLADWRGGITTRANRQLLPPLRDLHVMARSRRSLAPMPGNKTCYLQDVFYGSDGIRTRDLRRDRPVLALAG
jgi:hypothetical protein